ncbi:MAG: hypothetical protein QM569_13450 [Acidovorax sp.]|uniref:hypothetical protein n=1 Tax=Acidovorax sp. TaxID=1872122 RepID=UPI0039E2FD03
MRLAFTLFAALWAASLANAQEAADNPHAAAMTERTAQRQQIQHEREALKARQLKEEAACYQRFAVEDCLRGVRAGVRDAATRLRAREIALNDAERREKAADRLKAIEQKQPPTPAQPSTDVAAPHNAQAIQAQRDRDAAQRAQQQRAHIRNQASAKAQRQAGSAASAARARERRAQTLKAAEEHRARVEKARATAAAQGRKPAAPLPASSQTQ